MTADEMAMCMTMDMNMDMTMDANMDATDPAVVDVNMDATMAMFPECMWDNTAAPWVTADMENMMLTFTVQDYQMYMENGMMCQPPT